MAKQYAESPFNKQRHTQPIRAAGLAVSAASSSEEPECDDVTAISFVASCAASVKLRKQHALVFIDSRESSPVKRRPSAGRRNVQETSCRFKWSGESRHRHGHSQDSKCSLVDVANRRQPESFIRVVATTAASRREAQVEE